MTERKTTRGREAWALALLLYVLAFTFPFLRIFNRETLVLGVPLIVLYLLLAWFLFIFFIFLWVRGLGGSGEDGPGTGPP